MHHNCACVDKTNVCYSLFNCPLSFFVSASSSSSPLLSSLPSLPLRRKYVSGSSSHRSTQLHVRVQSKTSADEHLSYMYADTSSWSQPHTKHYSFNLPLAAPHVKKTLKQLHSVTRKILMTMPLIC